MATTRVGDDGGDDRSGVRVDGPRPAPSFSSPSPSPPLFSPSPLFSPASSSSLLQWRGGRGGEARWPGQGGAVAGTGAAVRRRRLREREVRGREK